MCSGISQSKSDPWEKERELKHRTLSFHSLGETQVQGGGIWQRLWSESRPYYSFNSSGTNQPLSYFSEPNFVQYIHVHCSAKF